MSINNNKIEILEILQKKKKYLSLIEITSFFSKKVSSKTILRELNDLIKCNRVIKEGITNSAKYALDDILRYYKRFDFLYVHKDGENAGYFFKLKDKFRFYYSNSFLINLSKEIPTIPLDIDFYEYFDIPPVFEENLPEGINRSIVETTTKKSDDFELLEKLCDNIGDLYFSRSPETIDTKLENGKSYLSLLPEILGKNKKLEVLTDFNIELEEMQLFPENYDLSKLTMAKSDGISGFQYKKLVSIDFENKVISVDEKKSKDYILKPYSKLKADRNNPHYFPHISINEHLHMSFAKNELGFKVPYSAIIKKEEDQEYHYIVKRFDRYGTHRFAKNTFAPFMGLVSSTKYDTSSEKLFARISKILLNPKEKLELLKHYAYSVIISHEDMHTKNLSLIFEKDKVLFAPLYDIACTGLYDTSKGYDSHLTINGKQQNIRPNDFKDLCKQLSIEFKLFKNEANKIATIYNEKFPEYIEEIKKLGEIPFYKSKIKKRVGEEADWIREGSAIQFYNILENFHSRRIIKLKELGWLE